jgi:hypothetical protein
MKNLFSSILALMMGVTASVAQIPGMMSMPSAQPLEGTSLGANETSSYNGIALGNRVKLRGFVDFIYGYNDPYESTNEDDARFTTAGDVDFLFDFSPVTGEAHLSLNPNPDPGEDEVTLEQAFGRYSFNQDFNLSFGRQLTNLGFDADEAPGLYAVTPGYHGLGDAKRYNYVDGLRANFNNGQFGLSFGIHDDYFGQNNHFNDNIAIDLAASVMIVPGLEARLGYAHQDMDSDDISRFNTWIAYNPGDLTLALEFDVFNIQDDDLWDIMFLANYQFVDWFGATFRYSHEDFDNGTDHEADRFTLALLFTLTDNLFLNFEFSHTELDSDDVEEVYLEGLLTF